MCSSNNSTGALMSFGMKLGGGQFPYYTAGSPHLSMEIQRAQLQDYAQRLQLGLRSFPGQVAGVNPLAYHGHVMHPYLHPYFCKDPRARFVHEEPKPNHSYIGLIAMGILSSRDKKLVLSDIYQWILDNYSYFRTRGPGWRNSIRHNLSLNDCFIKSGRSANGKGHYWAIHPANIEDFQKGDFRRRRAQRRVRKHMGLSVPDDEDDDSPLPSPAPQQADWTKTQQEEGKLNANEGMLDESARPHPNANSLLGLNNTNQDMVQQIRKAATNRGFRRQFDVESLLAPEPDYYRKMRAEMNSVNFDEPEDIFALDKQKKKEEIKREELSGDTSETNVTIKDNNVECVSDEESTASPSQSTHEYDNQTQSHKINCNGCPDTNDNYDENELNDTDSSQRCVISINNNDVISTENKHDNTVVERKSDNVQNEEDNQKESSSENEEERQTQHIVNAPYGYVQLNNYSNVNDIGSIYYADKQSYISQFGKLVRFPFHPQHSILTGSGGQLDMEAAHRWQQSMASLLMKTQVKE